MNYLVNPCAWGHAFAVPAQVVDNYIKMAGAIQLKVLLWLLRHSGEDLDLTVLSAAIGKAPEDVIDALQFWVECGVILKDGEAPAPIRQNIPADAALSSAVPSPVTAKVLAPLPLSRPTNDQILARCDESSDIRFLFNEAQTKLGKTIGFDSQSTLLMMHDQYGLPIEVILMIIEYCISVGKTSIGYIASIGKDWGEKEIDTLEKADEQIQVLSSCNTLWKNLAEAAGIKTPRPTTVQSKYLRCWNGEWGFNFEMIYLAYEEMANHTDSISFNYMNKILSNWHEAGIKTPEDAESAKLKRVAAKSAGKQSVNQRAKKIADGDRRPPSYDLEEFKRRSLHEPLVYEKRKKE